MEYIREVSKINGKNMVRHYYIYIKLKKKKKKQTNKQRKYIIKNNVIIRKYYRTSLVNQMHSGIRVIYKESLFSKTMLIN